MKQALLSFWGWLTRSQYTLYLERENADLKEKLTHWQNIVLLNQRLPTLPRPQTDDKKLVTNMPRRMTHNQIQFRIDHDAARREQQKPQVEEIAPKA